MDRIQNSINTLAALERISDGVTVFASDLTSRKQVEIALKEKQEKLILLSEAANHLFFKKEPKELLDA